MAEDKTKEYWNKNIESWGKFYLDISHSDEELDAPRWVRSLYRRFIVPLEARLMTERYKLTMAFIDKYVTRNTVVADIGCGTGVFTVEMLRRGARVIAVDVAQASLSLTKSLVDRVVPECAASVEYLLADVVEQRLPNSDVAVAMGVTPYVKDLDAFYGNILPTTKVFYCLILDPMHWANLLRKFIPILNVRNLNWFDAALVDSLLASHQWRLIDRQPFASGYLDISAGPGHVER
jgi:SAM-dependent methyltransferase